MSRVTTYEKILRKEDEGIYIYIPIEIEEDVERLEISYDYTPWRPKGSAWLNDVDMILIDDKGCDVGTRGSVIRHAVISPYYSTPGFDVREITKGTWNVVVLPARMISEEIDLKVHVKTFKKERRWYAGDTHTHTHNSDGLQDYRKLIGMAKKAGFDYMFITDHNRTILHMPKSHDFLTIVPGIEYTYPNGHANAWGIQQPYSGTFITNNQEGFLKLKEESEAKGALVSINHPMCSKCGWHWPLDNFDFDVVEIWNGPMRIDNLKAIDWWHNELVKGRKLSAVGGSDYHRDYYIVKLFGKPVTHIYSEGRSQADLLKAIKEGRTSISWQMGSTFIEITSGDSVVGDTVTIKSDTKIKVNVSNLKRGHTLKVYDQEGEIYTYKAKRRENHTVEIPVKNAGFVRAYVRYNLKGFKRFIFNLGMLFAMPEQAFMKEIPPMVEAICSPIWFEK